ncbi:MAG: hypothetical protein ACE5FU_04595, partial [Nitrospinota bacterium]
ARHKESIDYLRLCMKTAEHQNESRQLKLFRRLSGLRKQVKYFSTDEYLKSLVGTIGLDISLTD